MSADPASIYCARALAERAARAARRGVGGAANAPIDSTQEDPEDRTCNRRSRTAPSRLRAHRWRGALPRKQRAIYDQLAVAGAEVARCSRTPMMLTPDLGSTRGHWWTGPAPHAHPLLCLSTPAYPALRSFTEGSERTARFAAVYGVGHRADPAQLLRDPARRRAFGPPGEPPARQSRRRMGWPRDRQRRRVHRVRVAGGAALGGRGGAPRQWSARAELCDAAYAIRSGRSRLCPVARARVPEARARPHSAPLFERPSGSEPSTSRKP